MTAGPRGPRPFVPAEQTGCGHTVCGRAVLEATDLTVEHRGPRGDWHEEMAEAIDRG